MSLASPSLRIPKPLRDARLQWLLLILGAGSLAYQGIFKESPFPMRHTPAMSDSERIFFSPVGDDSAFIIFALTAWMVARRLPRLLETLGKRESIGLGFLGSSFALGILVWADYTSSPGLATASLSLFLVGGGLFLAGRAGARSMLLPAVFMALLAIPLSPVLVNPLIFPLQLWTAQVTTTLLNWSGVIAFQSGDLILTRAATFQVIETCSGFRITHTLIMSAIVYAEIFHRSRRRLVLLLLASPFVGIFVNLVRVISLVLNPKGDVVPIHTAQGIIMLVAGVLLLALLDRLFQSLWPDPAHPLRSSDRRPTTPETPLPRARILWLTGSLLAAFLAQWLIPPWSFPPHSENLLDPLPKVVGEWTMQAKPPLLDPMYLGTTGFSSRMLRKYTGSDGHEIELFIGTNDRTGRAPSLISPKTETLRAGFYVVERSPLPSTLHGEEINEIIARDAKGSYWMIHHGYRNVESLPLETTRRFMALERSFLRRSEPTRVLRIATPTDPDPGNREIDRARIQNFKQAAMGSLNEF